ncbi:SIR2 family protein [Neisseria animaloris]|uniref:Uncharacterized protein n=1 Tax=Neisseria animaloris TaxID=326522 RepID=A0A448U9X5_9NEIS|nr:SIR2 family protein [Neisseria animaloris]VEJ20691.1 Uncharacterised protein [Neisseria animaloris]
MNLTESIVAILSENTGGPFLFIGSGFSRRYLGLEDWTGLLNKFCLMGKPIEFYRTQANGSLPEAAELIAKEFNDFWWSNPKNIEEIDKYKSVMQDNTSALRIEICNYLRTLDQSVAKKSEFINEIEILSNLNVDGIITTNWDKYIEQLYPDYRVYIGQDQLLFSHPQGIGEIYKIHGCVSRPQSLVLTKNDYEKFQSHNAYLAAKLITIFVEHPVIFIGYSLSDANIQNILLSITHCMGQENINKLRKNLIFLQRLKSNEKEGISDSTFIVNDIQIPVTLIKTNDFSQCYRALENTKRKIPVRILRHCKEQMYQLVNSSHPEEKLCVMDIEEIDDTTNIEFIVGVGVISQQEHDNPTSVGYSSITINNLIDDLLLENHDYDPTQLLEHVIPSLLRNSPNVPIFKYLKAVGITTEDNYLSSNYKGKFDKSLRRKELKDFGVNSVKRTFFKYRHMNLSQLIENCSPENVAQYVPFMSKEKIDLEELLEFLIENKDKITDKSYIYHSNFRKLATIYDKLKWGW